MKPHLYRILAVVLAGNLGILEAAPPAIGTVTAKGAFRSNQATVSNNASLLEGATIETTTVGSSMELSSGARFSLAPDSKGRFFGDRVVLERGEGRLEKTVGLRVEARGLTIHPETGNSTGRIALLGNARVQLAALTGSFRVLNARGAVVAHLPPGLTLAFEPQGEGAGGITKLTGTLQNKGGHYLITDETTNVTLEVTGAGLEKDVGWRVEVIGAADPGATPVSDASQLINATSVRRLQGRKAAAAGVGGAAGGAAAGAGIGAAISGTTIAVVGGIAAAATVGGLAASGKLSGLSR